MHIVRSCSWQGIFSQWTASLAKVGLPPNGIPERVRVEGFAVFNGYELDAGVILWCDRDELKSIREALAARLERRHPWPLRNFEAQISSGRDAYPGIRQTAGELISAAQNDEAVSAVWLYAWLWERFESLPDRWRGPIAIAITEMKLVVRSELERLGLSTFHGNVRRTLPSCSSYLRIHTEPPPQSIPELLDFAAADVAAIIKETIIVDARATVTHGIGLNRGVMNHEG